MTEPNRVDVLVVGAGPTGLALAAELAAFGIRFRIVDRQPDRVHESRALAIQPRTLEVLARHGLASQLVDAGNPAVHLHLHTPSRVVALRLFDIGITDTGYPFLLFLSQADTERILGEHLFRQGMRVERGVLGVLHDPDGTALRRLGTDPHTPVHYLIRPDGHLAYRNRGTDLTGLHRYLTHWLKAAT